MSSGAAADEGTPLDGEKREDGNLPPAGASDRYRLLFAHSRDVVLFIKRRDGRIIEANPAAELAYGYSREALLALTIQDLRALGTQAQTAEQMAAADSGGLVFETLHRRKDGSLFAVEVNSQGMEIDGERILLSIVRDLTARQEARAERARLLAQVEQEKAAAQQRADELDAVIEAMNDPVLVHDRAGEVVRANRAARRVFGERMPEMQQANLRRPGGGPADPAELPLVRALRDETITNDLWELDGAGGQPVYLRATATPLVINGRQVGVVAAWHDVSALVQAEEAARLGEARLRQLADSMPQLVWTARPDGMVDYYNRRHIEYGGIRQDETADSWQWAPVVHPDDMEATLAAWNGALATGEVYQVEHRVFMADGRVRWHLSRATPLRAADGQILQWFGTATDIHDQKQAEADLKIYAERLEHSNRDLEQFAYMASHDLKEPLRKIEAFGSALVRSGDNLTEKQADYLERMRSASERMRTMVDDLLALSRAQRSEEPFVPVDLGETAREALSDLEQLARRTGGEVQIEPLPVIEADPQQMRQLLVNLLSNALKFHRLGEPPQVRVSARRPSASAVELEVADNGIGFDDNQAERIFQPFQRLVGRSEYEGSGIGLAICRRIVERHHGRLSVRSRPGEGAVFTVWLPERQR